jgi:hypothetical protein
VDKQRKCKNVHHWSKHIFQMRSYLTSLSLVCIYCGHKSVISKENHTFILQSWKIVCPIFVNACHIQKCLLWNFYILIQSYFCRVPVFSYGEPFLFLKFNLNVMTDNEPILTSYWYF